MRVFSRRIIRAASLLFAAVPFAFAVIRAVQTQQDIRYLWVALPTCCGAVATMAIAGHRIAGENAAAVPVAGAVFVVATVLAVVMGLLLGTRLGPGLLVVASGFGFCFAVGSFFYVVARA